MVRMKMRGKPPKNPVTIARRALGISAREFALAAGISVSHFHKVEGAEASRLPPAVLETFTRLGVDAEALAGKYTAYRMTLGRKVLEMAIRPEDQPVEPVES